MNGRYRISSSCYNDKFLSFDLSNPETGDWTKAVGVFKNRFDTRYFNPIKHLLSVEDSVEQDISEADMFYPGFVTLSIDCILLETLNQFNHGINDSNIAFHNRCAFAQILSDIKSLAPFFSTKEYAYKFYDDVRCGLIHQGQTKEDSKLNKTKNFIINHYENGGSGFDVNRSLFHQTVIDEFNNYQEAVKNVNDRSSDQLRLNFRNKMHFLCGSNLPQKKEEKCLFCGEHFKKVPIPQVSSNK